MRVSEVITPPVKQSRTFDLREVTEEEMRTLKWTLANYDDLTAAHMYDKVRRALAD